MRNHRSTYFSSTERVVYIASTIETAKYFLDSALEVEKEKSFTKVGNVNEDMTMDEAYSLVNSIMEEVSRAVDLLEIMFKPQLSVKEKQVLHGLREDLSKLKDLGLDEVIVRDIEKSITELEIPNYLSSSMIAARATVYMSDKINGNGENKDVDKIKKLESLGIVDKDEISHATSKSFLEAVRSARNLVLHKIGFIPTPSEANSYVSSTIKMGILFQKYLEKSTKQ